MASSPPSQSASPDVSPASATREMSRGQALLIALELMVVPLVLTYLAGEYIARRPDVQELILTHANPRPRVNRERIKLDYDLSRARATGKRIVVVAGASQTRDCFDADAVSALLQDDELVAVNISGSAFSPVDLHALRRVWLGVEPALLVYTPHAFFLSDWHWALRDQRWDWVTTWRYIREEASWEKRDAHYVGLLSQVWAWTRYRQAVTAAIDRQVRELLRRGQLRTAAIDPYVPYEPRPPWDDPARSDLSRQKVLDNPAHVLHKWSRDEYYDFPTHASRALKDVLDLCYRHDVPVLLVEPPHHPATREFFSDYAWDAYKKELRRLAQHPAVARLVEMDAYPDVSEHFIGNFLHAQNARPILAPLFAEWIRQALQEARAEQSR